MNRTVRNAIFSASFILALGARSAFAEPATETVDIGIATVLAPSTGFDDNDNVQVVLHGQLPNACYQLGAATSRLTAEGVIEVQQASIHLMTGLCDEEELLPDYMKIPVPFTTEISLGALKAGSYRIEFQAEDGTRGTRAMEIAASTVPSIDDRLYAAVTAVYAPDVIASGEHLKITIQGLFNSDCVALEDTTAVLNEGDVTVVLPTLKVDANATCKAELRPFTRELDLGIVTGKHHLIHVRSMNGRGVNRVVEIRL